MRLLCNKKITLNRSLQDWTYNDNGDWVSGSVVQSEISCSIQPPFGNSEYIESNLPEGIKLKDCKNIYTKVKLETGSEYSDLNADELIIDGYKYEVYSVDEWFGGGSCRLSHYKSLAIRKDKIFGNN